MDRLGGVGNWQDVAILHGLVEEPEDDSIPDVQLLTSVVWQSGDHECRRVDQSWWTFGG